MAEVTKICTKELPTYMYTRYSNMYMTERPARNDVLNTLSGNPEGSKLSSIPYIYCIDEDEMNHGNYENIYFLKVHFKWPLYGYIASEDSEERKQYMTYEDYKREGYSGVKRRFFNMWRFVIFDPESVISNIFDVGTHELIYDKDRYKSDERTQEQLYEDRFSIDSSLVYFDHGKCQTLLDKLMIETIGSEYISKKRDVFCITEIARRHSSSPYSVYKRLVPIIERIVVHKASGCWVSSRKKDYKRLFWMSLGGICHRDIFSFCQDIEKDPNIFIKNKNILHSNLCELTLGVDHTKCCRPSHLRLGTSRENAIHIKVRKNIEQFFDFTPDELRQYSYHIYCLATMIEKQLHTLTKLEKKQMEKRKGNKILIYENADGKFVQRVIGNPHMGENSSKCTKYETKSPGKCANETDDILGLKELFIDEDSLQDYKTKLAKSNLYEVDTDQTYVMKFY